MTLSRLHDVFLSYSRKDTDMMHRVRNALIAEGITVWTDEGIEPGTDLWQKAIQNAIENAGAMVVLLSPDAKASLWVGREINYAQTHSLEVFPLLIRGDEKSSLPFGLAGSQYLDLRTDFNLFNRKLIPTLTDHLGIESVSKIRERLTQKEAELDQLQRQLEQELTRLVQNSGDKAEITQLQLTIKILNKQHSDDKEALEALKQSLVRTQRLLEESQKREQNLTNQKDKFQEEGKLSVKEGKSINSILTALSVSLPNSSNSQLAIHPLVIWSPISWLRLLCWLIITPTHYYSYIRIYGESKIKLTASVLESTFIWMPMWIVTLGATLGTIPFSTSQAFGFSISDWCLIVIGGWLFTIFLDVLMIKLLYWILIIIFTIVFTGALSMSLGVGGVVTTSSTGAVVNLNGTAFEAFDINDITITIIMMISTLGITGISLVGTGSFVMVFVALGLALGLTLGLALGVAGSAGGDTMGGVVVGLAGIVSSGIVISIMIRFVRNNPKAEKISFQGYFTLFILIIAYATLVYIFLFGGYKFIS